MSSVTQETTFLTQPNYYMVGPSPSEIDVPTVVTHTLTVTGTATIPGFITAAASVGSGASVIASITGSTLDLRSFTSASGTLTVTQNTNTLNFDLPNIIIPTGVQAPIVNVDQYGRVTALTTMSSAFGVSFTQVQSLPVGTTAILANATTGSPTLTAPTEAGFNTATGVYTVPINAFVAVNVHSTTSSSTTILLQVLRNGVVETSNNTYSPVTSPYYTSVSWMRYCSAADTISVQAVNQSSNTTGTVTVTIAILSS
jgi:hypothetical protein